VYVSELIGVKFHGVQNSLIRKTLIYEISKRNIRDIHMYVPNSEDFNSSHTFTVGVASKCVLSICVWNVVMYTFTFSEAITDGDSINFGGHSLIIG
jgi:hypothetical protein